MYILIEIKYILSVNKMRSFIIFYLIYYSHLLLNFVSLKCILSYKWYYYEIICTNVFSLKVQCNDAFLKIIYLLLHIN